ncbi:hypothetical protein MHAS_04167 [Mycolicibacterium hassiacum DSM 44199]|nr:hypothetical protein MHAS_04167 [Mycolicibacterium hassiacum DSM 44199]
MKPFEPAATVARQPRDRALCGVRSGESGERAGAAAIAEVIWGYFSAAWQAAQINENIFAPTPSKKESAST